MLTPSPDNRLYIGLMSGTSLDGVDAVLAAIPRDGSSDRMRVLASAYLAFPDSLRADLLALQSPGYNEIHHEALAANALVQVYGQCVDQALHAAGIKPASVHAIGVHGQTIRHRPECGYTRQSNNPALLAELTGIDVIADFRSRDIAAGGQGAPLVPAFHQEVFGQRGEIRVVLNIGGISNVSILDGDRVLGFDTGPGNVLLDAWIAQHLGRPYDKNGAWAASGNMLPDLLETLQAEPFFFLPPPKSTGRDLFHPTWLSGRLANFPDAKPADVQATLTAFTATTIAEAIHQHAPATNAVYVCGGGAYNARLMAELGNALRSRNVAATLQSTEVLGISPNQVESFAFAWLAHRFCERMNGNLPAVTGAKASRILGALYPAK